MASEVAQPQAPPIDGVDVVSRDNDAHMINGYVSSTFFVGHHDAISSNAFFVGTCIRLNRF